MITDVRSRSEQNLSVSITLILRVIKDHTDKIPIPHSVMTFVFKHNVIHHMMVLHLSFRR